MNPPSQMWHSTGAVVYRSTPGTDQGEHTSCGERVISEMNRDHPCRWARPSTLNCTKHTDVQRRRMLPRLTNLSYRCRPPVNPPKTSETLCPAPSSGRDLTIIMLGDNARLVSNTPGTGTIYRSIHGPLQHSVYPQGYRTAVGSE